MKEQSVFAPKNNLLLNCQNCNSLLPENEPKNIAFYTKKGEQILCNECWVLYKKGELDAKS